VGNLILPTVGTLPPSLPTTPIRRRPRQSSQRSYGVLDT